MDKSKFETTSDLRRFLAHLATGIVSGDIEHQKAAVAIKACKEINNSLYSEIKAATIEAELARIPAALGDLKIANK